MRYEKRIIEAFQSNGITKILLIDDAYDPPEFNGEAAVALDDFFLEEDNRKVCLELGIEQNILDAAMDAARGADTESEELGTVYRTLYAKFTQTREKKIDLRGRFESVKGASLDALNPLYVLLCKCGEKVNVCTAGMIDGQKIYHEFHPHVVFLDYYLDSNVSPTGTVKRETLNVARSKSLSLLGEVVNNTDGESIPAIVLISSRKIKDVEEYRHDAKGEILSLRFGFLRKDMVRQGEKEIEIDYAAVDALLDVSQGYLFGKALQCALSQWKDGAESALKVFMEEIRDLHTKDFAYLLRFRLREEGMPLNEYLEWLFGECLKGLINEKVDWENTSFSELEDNKKIEENIEGAFGGPSMMIAKLFHRSRVDSHRISACRGYRLGDLYAQPDMHNIRAVLTPDCDLVERGGPPKAKRILTMGGTLRSFDQHGSTADDFLLHENRAYSVLWSPKDLKTFPIDGEESLHESYKFVGTLRPLYAQEMQRRALTDLSRVGLPVTPAFGIDATASIWIRKKKGCYEHIKINSSTHVTIIPARAGQRGGHRVLLPRPFVNELIDRLNDIDLKDMNRNDAKSLRSILKEDQTDKLYEEFLKTGGQTQKRIFGMDFVFGDKPDTAQDAPWMQIVLKISDETMQELRIMDPLA